ncbi:MAG: phosphotransferase, partial [Nakamurella sp.]
MFAEPADLDRELLRTALASGWGINDVAFEYHPVGFGTHHYLAGTRSTVWFVNVDELAEKPAGAEQGFDALDSALRMALAPRESGLEFVHAPIRRDAGGVLD